MTCVVLHTRKLNANQRNLAFNIIASNYDAEYSKARKEADDDLDFDRDMSDAIDSACSVDTDLLPKSKRARVVEEFGQEKFSIDNSNLYMTIGKEYVGNTPLPGVFVVETDLSPPKKTFVAKKDMTLFESGDSSGDEMVTIKIKTGKGGRATYRVPKSEAGDMVGCD